MTAEPAAEPDPFEGVVIPSKPQILVDIQMAGNDTEKVIDLIEKDTGISASVLKTINSPYFGLRVNVASIGKAVMLLGIDSVVAIVNSQALRANMSNNTDVNLGEYWDSSMDVAKAAGSIATQSKMCARDTAYTLGLFHNCGIPILLQKHPDFMETVKLAYSDARQGILKVERQATRLDHAYVGYKLCKLWNLSDKLCQTIRYHHHGKAFFTDDKFSPEVKILGAVLMFAEHIAEVHKTLGGQSAEHNWEAIRPFIIETLDLNEESYQNIKEYILDTVYA